MLIRAVYTLLLALAAPLLLFGLYNNKSNKPKFSKRWKEHFGVTPELKSDQKPIWIHAVSVGESIAAIPLIKALKEQAPNQPILVTTTTSTGAEQISKLGSLVEHRYMPIDFSFAVKSFLKVTKPRQMLVIETELWPNTLNEVNKFGIPIIIVNARLSKKSRDNYAKFRPIFNIIEPCLTQVLCQHKSDAEHFRSLGVPNSKLKVTGSIKFDIQISEQTLSLGKQLRQAIGERPVWIAASTHKGEDEIIIAAHKYLLSKNPNALLILVPRHPERFDAVFNLCINMNLSTIRRTQNIPPLESNVYLGDTMGEMLIFMAAADLCFMGGSLIGSKVGGHNIIEPIALGLPVLIGPSYYNFKEIVDEQIKLNNVSVISQNSLLENLDTFANNYKGNKVAPSSIKKGAIDSSVTQILLNI
ncbi:lipid IV(A) 3-deoxy-D-manno-octulosonic acid transferase [Vibrio maerlii]|uniref:lipid IV(A) 3-deoxy-D-manno-octulosonic acid transferase n=1 Tax=Vibrio maerlii TaxID=2231648 RepID=UPI000E3D7C38|nr:lipid IV(A) 3-deoxy-D-manno-octulosonic acid transferase [Vibrio maerlii]